MWTVDLPLIDTLGTLTPIVRAAIAAGATSRRHESDPTLITIEFGTQAAATAFLATMGSVEDATQELPSIALYPDRTTFYTGAPVNSIVSTIVDPYGSGSTYSIVGTPSSALNLVGNTVRKAAQATANTTHVIKVRCVSADGRREVVETFDFVCRAGAIEVPSLTNALLTEDGDMITTEDGDVLVLK
jgi:hypothetical protein